MSRGKKILDMLKLPSPNYNDTDSGLGARQNQLDFIENFEVEDMIFDNDNITSGQLSDDIINLENPLVNKGVQKATPTNTINAFPPAFLSDDTNDNNDSCPQIIIHNILTLKNSVVNTEVPDTNFTDVSDVSPQQPLNVISNNTVKGESLNYDSQSIFPCINNLLESVHATPCPDDIMELCQEEKEGIKIWQIEHEVRETVSQNTDLEESQVAMIESAQLVQPLPETLKLGRDETVDQDVSKDQDVEANTEKNENRSRTYTKNGNLRKRKKCGESRSVKKQKMDRKLRDSHPILPPCPAICKKRCFIKIDEKQRQQLNKDYWNLSWTERHMFVKGSIEQTIVKRRTIDVPAEDSKLRRNHSNSFLLKDKKGSLNSVCRTFFLTTLGYKKNNNTIIKTSISYKNNSSNSLTVRDNRGTHSNRRNVDRAVLERHVNLFHPCVSHYRREHAPHRKYLPSDITIKQMHTDFMEKHKNIDCSYYTYRAFVRDQMKISFTKLGHEECEQCEIFEQHDNNHSKNNMDLDTCEFCKKWNVHINKAKVARRKYRADAESTEWTATNICVSADLQKVIMLPRIDTFKQVLFTQRIIAFNESFVAVGKHQKFLGPSGVIWHEALAGRKKEELCSTFHKYLLSQRDVLSIKIWLDNCAAQNKNWTLFSFIAHIINSLEIATNDIEIYYFEPGHTYMSADSFHHQVEQSLNSYGSNGDGGKVYDFNDFQCAIEQVKMKNVKVLAMELTDFKDWLDHTSLQKIKKHSPRPYLSEIVKLKFQRGSYNMWYSYEYDAAYTELNFLTAKYLKQPVLPKSRERCRGITKSKKDDILKKLCPLMPQNRRHFWELLPISDEVVDLIKETDC